MCVVCNAAAACRGLQCACAAIVARLNALHACVHVYVCASVVMRNSNFTRPVCDLVPHPCFTITHKRGAVQGFHERSPASVTQLPEHGTAGSNYLQLCMLIYFWGVGSLIRKINLFIFPIAAGSAAKLGGRQHAC